MWTVLKFDKNNLRLLVKEFNRKLGNDFKVYVPKIKIQKFKNNKLIDKEFYLLGDYMFFFHKNLKEEKVKNLLKFTRGLKYILDGFCNSQREIENFIRKCKDSEKEDGFIYENFSNLVDGNNYKFSSGFFTDKIFQILRLQENKIKILMGNIKTTINRRKFLFTPA